MDSAAKQVKRLKKLYNMLYDMNFFRQIVIDLKCHLPSRIDPAIIQNDEKDQEILSEYLMPYIKPGESRFDLIEYLLSKIAKEQFDACRILENDPNELRIKSRMIFRSVHMNNSKIISTGIRILSSRLGMLTQSKFSKNLNFNKVMEGKSGLEPSLRFIYELAKLAKAHLKTKRVERELVHREIFLECTYTMGNLINVDANPFSVDFPLENELLEHDDIGFRISCIEEEVTRDREHNKIKSSQGEDENIDDEEDEKNLDKKQQTGEKDKENEVRDDNESVSEEDIEETVTRIEQNVLGSYELSQEQLASYKNQLEYLKVEIRKLFDQGHKETSRLQKKIIEQDYDNQVEKAINIDASFAKIYRKLQNLKHSIEQQNDHNNISDKLEELLQRIPHSE